MRKSLIVLVCFYFFITPKHSYAEKKIPVLVYHQIEEYSGHGTDKLFVSPTNFEKQMIYLRDHGFTLLTFDRWNEIPNVKKPIFITIDDGYKNVLNAFEIFQKLKSDQFTPSATSFVISDYIGWSDRLTKTDIKRISDSGLFSIQSHSATHPELTKVTTYEHELKDSKEKIEQITGKPVIALAYPYGLYNNKVIEETKKYYTYGISTIPNYFIKKGKKDELYKIPRIYITYTMNIDEFTKIVEGKQSPAALDIFRTRK